MSGQLRHKEINSETILRRWHAPRELDPRRSIDHQIKLCIRAYGLRALLIAADGERVFVRTARDPKIAVDRLRLQLGPGLALCRVWWGSPKDMVALQLAWSAASERLDATIHGLLGSAQAQGIMLVPDHVVRARAYDFVERVNLEFEDLRRNGRLRDRAPTGRGRRPTLLDDEFEQKAKLRLLYSIIKQLDAYD